MTVATDRLPAWTSALPFAALAADIALLGATGPAAAVVLAAGFPLLNVIGVVETAWLRVGGADHGASLAAWAQEIRLRTSIDIAPTAAGVRHAGAVHHLAGWQSCGQLNRHGFVARDADGRAPAASLGAASAHCRRSHPRAA